MCLFSLVCTGVVKSCAFKFKSTQKSSQIMNNGILNERLTESLVRDKFRNLGYYNSEDLSVEEQRSSIPRVDKLLQTASKKGSGKGYPEFIITSKSEPDFVCVIECKADVKKHMSPALNRYADFAVDGAKLYADYLSKEMDVLFIGVSGQSERDVRISHFLKLKDEKGITPVFDKDILSFDAYIEQYKKIRFRVDYDSLMNYVRGLNKKLHAKKIPENNRAILFSGILLALEDETFYNSYASYKSASRLSDFLVDSIVQKLEYSNIHPTRIYEMQQAYNFIKTHTALIDEGYILELVREIHNEIRTFIKTNNYFDIISSAYVEFLKYANNDKKLGIVLTPPHITELFCDLANITKDSVVLDNCCGTSGFLVAAMQRMVDEAKGNKEKILNIKTKQLIGIEYQDHIFTLGVSNMIIHGDGKTNIIKGDCFSRIGDVRKYHPTVGFLNPPYNDTTGINELKFILNNLSAIEKNGCVVAIVPMSCALYQSGEGAELKRKLLEEHTLEAVMSMPDDLFYPVGVVTCIMVFTAHLPQSISKRKTWFGYWKNDGFVKTKQQGRTDSHGRWSEVRSKWIESFRNREVHPGESVMHHVSATDEWCAEAFMETDYSSITKLDFELAVRNYSIFRMLENSKKMSNLDSGDEE